MHEMPTEVERGIDLNLYDRIRKALSKSEVVRDPEMLSAVFVIDRLYQWRDDIPEGDTVKKRVIVLIDWLYRQQNCSKQNGLVLFLKTLSDLAEENDLQRRAFGSLAEELAM